MCGGAIGEPRELYLSEVYLTEEKLKQKGAQCEGLDWFKAMFPSGAWFPIAIAACNHPGWIKWALDAFGRTR